LKRKTAGFRLNRLIDAAYRPLGKVDLNPAMDIFFQQVCTFIQDNWLLPQGSRVLAGVSGGADSLALLILLSRLREPLALRLAAAHLNHGLRGEAADADEDFVRQWCVRLDVPFFSSKVDLTDLAAQRGQGLEETGRQERLAFFERLARQFETEGFPGDPAPPAGMSGAATLPVRIALAHHLDDQAETLLLHLGRGCGLDGLVGMKPQSGRLIRPFLGQPRCAIEQWLTEGQIAWRQDETNQDVFALRNRLRNQVLPAWRQALGYDPAPLLQRTAASLSEDQQLLSELTQAAALRCLTLYGLRVAEWCRQPPALQNRILRLYWQEKTGSSRDLARKHLMALRNWLAAATAGQRLSLPGRWSARLGSDGYLRLVQQPVTNGGTASETDGADGAAARGRTRQAQVTPATGWEDPDAQGVQLALPGKTRIEAWNLEIEASLIENEDQIVYNSAMEYFRLDRIQGCVVRHRRPGDLIRPHGRLGGKTLKKFLNEQKIPLERRSRLLLIAKDSNIIWLPGYAAGASYVGRPGDGRPGPLIRIVWHWPDSADMS
jgi:tRNA(Ile)-lysidine synthase